MILFCKKSMKTDVANIVKNKQIADVILLTVIISFLLN